MTIRTLTCEVTPAQIKAALLFAANQDVRAYLNGACLEHSAKGTRLFATDGNRIIVIRLDETPVVGDPVRYVVSRDVLESVVKGFGKVPSVAFVWEQSESIPDETRPGVMIVPSPVVHVHGIKTEDLQVNRGKYPQTDRVVPTECSGKRAQFSASFIMDCAKARKALGERHPDAVVIMHNGDSPALIVLSESAFAAVAPMRNDSEKMTAPSWYTGKPAAAKDEKKAA